MEEKTVGFGPYLIAHRLEKDMSLDEVARRTRIGAETLRLIETQDLDRLPVPVFVLGFLRAYAKTVGADGNEAVRRYQAHVDRRPPALETRPGPTPAAPRLWPRLLATAALMLGWMAVSIWVLGDRDGGTGAKSAGAVAVPRSPAASPRPAPETLPPRAAPLPYRLEITAMADTWLQVVTDGGSPRQFRLDSGQRLDLGAQSGFVLLMGDAGAVALQLNGKALQAAGSRGQVKTLYLP
jgi:hypothetical protein